MAWLRKRRQQWYICTRGPGGREDQTCVGGDEGVAREMLAVRNEARRMTAAEMAAYFAGLAAEIRDGAAQIDDLVADFLAERGGLAPSTVESYSLHLRRFAVSFSRTWRASTTGQVRAWLATQPNTASTARTLRAFGRYCAREGTWPDNPLARLTSPQSRKRAEFLTPAQVAAAEAMLTGDELLGPFLAGVKMGLRADEICHARLEHLHVAERTLLIAAHGGWRPKGGRERLVPVHPSLMPLLPDGDRGWLFMRVDGKPWTRHALYVALKRRTGAHPHMLRHTAASLMQMAGVPPSVARDILGHSTLDMTNRYTHTIAPALHEAMARVP